MKKFLLIPAVLLLSVSSLVYAQGWNIEMLDSKYKGWHSAYDIVYQGDYAYIGLDYFTIGGGGIVVLDISDLNNPMEIEYFETRDDINDMEIDGNYIYVGYYGLGLSILDISNPINPVEIFVSL